MPDLNELKRGDIIVINHNGLPYHIAIYAPQPELIGDIIHMGSGFKRTGIVRSTLAHIFHLHQGLNKAGNFFGAKNTLEVKIYRPKVLNGENIAKQAEVWSETGAVFDEKRLVDTVESNEDNYDISDEAQIANLFQYLKYAARREVMPIKTLFSPYPSTSISSGFGSFFMAPSLNLPSWIVSWGHHLIKKGTATEERPNGFTCAGFILACIGAVAFKDDIAPVNSEIGWISLKNAKAPNLNNTPYFKAWKILQENSLAGKEIYPGLDRLLTAEQQENFDISALLKKISFLAKLHPHRPSIRAFMEAIQDDSKNWEDLGILNEPKLGEQASLVSRSFETIAYKEEIKAQRQKVQNNHQAFGQTYGHIAFQSGTYRNSFWHQAVSWITGETISDISNYTPQ